MSRNNGGFRISINPAAIKAANGDGWLEGCTFELGQKAPPDDTPRKWRGVGLVVGRYLNSNGNLVFTTAPCVVDGPNYLRLGLNLLRVEIKTVPQHIYEEMRREWLMFDAVWRDAHPGAEL